MSQSQEKAMVVCLVEMCHNVRYEEMLRVSLAQPTRHEMRVPLGMFLRDGEKKDRERKINKSNG